MKKITAVLLIFSLASCGIFKSVHKEKTLDKIETSTVSKSDSSGLTVDKSTTVIKERADTVITVPGRTVKQDTYLNMDSLVNGMTAVKNDLLDVKLVLNPVTGILSVIADLHPQSIPVKIDKTTTKNNDITQSGSKSTENKSQTNEKHKSNNVEKTPKNSVWFVIMVIAVAAVCIWGFKKFF